MSDNNYKIETTLLFNDLPQVNTIEYKITGAFSRTMQVIRWPTGNCQLSSIVFGYYVLYVRDEHMQEFMQHLVKVSNKSILFDLNEEKYKPVMKKIGKYVSKVNIKRYINTNGNKMVMCIVKFNRDAIFNNPFN